MKALLTISYPYPALLMCESMGKPTAECTTQLLIQVLRETCGQNINITILLETVWMF